MKKLYGKCAFVVKKREESEFCIIFVCPNPFGEYWGVGKVPI